MPQLDNSIVFSILFSSVPIIIVYYKFFAVDLLTEVVVLKKFRVKKTKTFRLKNIAAPNLEIYRKLLTIKCKKVESANKK